MLILTACELQIRTNGVLGVRGVRGATLFLKALWTFFPPVRGNPQTLCTSKIWLSGDTSALLGIEDPPIIPRGGYQCPIGYRSLPTGRFGGGLLPALIAPTAVARSLALQLDDELRPVLLVVGLSQVLPDVMCCNTHRRQQLLGKLAETCPLAVGSFPPACLHRSVQHLQNAEQRTVGGPHGCGRLAYPPP